MNVQAYSKFISWKMLVWLFIIQLFIAFVGRSIAPLGLVIGEDLHLTKAQIGMFPAALFLGQAIISIPSGIVTDKIGSRKMILFITLLLGTTFFVISVTQSFILLLIFIVFAGFAYGASHPTTNRGIVYWFPQQMRGTAMGLKQMGVTLGSASAALILLPIASNYGWQTATLFASVSLLVVGIFIYFVYKEPENNQLEQDNQTKEKINLAQIFQLFKHKILVLITISAMLLSGTQMILNTFIILFAYEKIGLTLIVAGTLLIIAELGGSLGRICWGIISDRIFKGKRIIVLLLISMIVAVVSMIIALLPSGTPFFILAIIVFIFGFGTSGFNGIWMNATTEIVEPTQSGVATGFSITFSSLGAVLFPPIFGSVVDYTGSYTGGWLFVTVLMIVSMITLTIIINKVKHRSKII